ncbi:MAG: hypothetical protein IIC59_14740, partial [Proteobacteria bacterium]|nr:hypothetical protein [Pseudomonadota bacterium]
MMKVQSRNFRIQTLIFNLVALVMMMTTAATHAQRLPGTENGEWRYLGGDAGHTRYSPLDQINASNFGELEEVWAWRSDNFGP